MTINERLFSTMKDQGISIRELSRRTGITASTISDWNTKHTNPSADKIMILCDVLNISPSYLLTGEEELSTDMVLSKDEKVLIETYRNFDSRAQQRFANYMHRINKTKEE